MVRRSIVRPHFSYYFLKILYSNILEIIQRFQTLNPYILPYIPLYSQRTASRTAKKPRISAAYSILYSVWQYNQIGSLLWLSPWKHSV